MYIFRSLLVAVLIYWCQANIPEFMHSSENASAYQLPQHKFQYITAETPSHTEKDGLEFWTRHPASNFRRLRFFRTSSRTGSTYPSHDVSSRIPEKIKKNIRVSELDDKHSRPRERKPDNKEHKSITFDKWENQTYILRSVHRDTEIHSQIRDANTTQHKPRMHTFLRPALLDDLHKTLSKVDEIMRKPHIRRLAEEMSNKVSLGEGLFLSKEESIYRGKSTRFSTSVSKWPKVITRRRIKQDHTASRNPKAIGKAIARKPDCDDEKSTNFPMHLVNQETTQGQALGDANTKDEGEGTTTPKSRFGPALSPYSIKAHLEDLASQFRHANISIEVIGRTVSYNDIVLLKATEKRESKEKYFRAEDKFLDEGPEKKIIFIVHGLSVMGIHLLPCMLQKDPLKQLLSYYFAHLDKFDIFLIPMANPDGVTAATGEAWNKNASPQSSCSGVCLDRNFDVMFNSSRATSSCSQQYPGPSPFSEEETRAVRDVIHRYSHKIVAYMHLHSGTYTADVFKGDAVLYPRGYADIQSDDDKYIDLRGEIDEAMKNASFQVLTVAVDTLYNWYGKVSGTSVDYASSVYGIPYAMELVMQIYVDDPEVQNVEETESAVALREVWRRVIDAIFHSVHKFVHVSGD